MLHEGTEVLIVCPGELLNGTLIHIHRYNDGHIHLQICLGENREDNTIKEQEDIPNPLVPVGV